MSRAGYSDDLEPWSLICWRGAVTSAIRGKRGQAFLRELLNALDALPEKVLVSGALRAGGAFCALGSVAHARCLPEEKMVILDQAMEDQDFDLMANEFGVNEKMLREIMFENDELGYGTSADGTRDEIRFRQFRNWVESHLIEWDASPSLVTPDSTLPDVRAPHKDALGEER